MGNTVVINWGVGPGHIGNTAPFVWLEVMSEMYCNLKSDILYYFSLPVLHVITVTNKSILNLKSY